MKKITYIALVLLAGLGISCERELLTEDISQVTYFPEFDYKGDEQYIVGCGAPFADPGVTATENGQEISVSKKITAMMTSGAFTAVGTIPDRYTISYNAVNKDGFSASTSREVWVACTGDLETSLEGLYTATVVRNGVSGAQYTDMQYIIIRKKSANVYELSDAIGGYYAIGRAYGDTYLASGIQITAKDIAKNDFTFNGPVGVGAFGGVLKMTSFEVNKATKTIVFSSTWDSGYDFVVTLKQVTI